MRLFLILYFISASECHLLCNSTGQEPTFHCKILAIAGLGVFHYKIVCEVSNFAQHGYKLRTAGLFQDITDCGLSAIKPLKKEANEILAIIVASIKNRKEK